MRYVVYVVLIDVVAAFPKDNIPVLVWGVGIMQAEKVFAKVVVCVFYTGGRQNRGIKIHHLYQRFARADRVMTGHAHNQGNIQYAIFTGAEPFLDQTVVTAEVAVVLSGT